MRASVMFKLAIAGLTTASIAAGFLFAGYLQAKPVAVLGVLVGCAAIAAGAIANLAGKLTNDLRHRK